MLRNTRSNGIVEFWSNEKSAREASNKLLHHCITPIFLQRSSYGTNACIKKLISFVNAITKIPAE